MRPRSALPAGHPLLGDDEGDAPLVHGADWREPGGGGFAYDDPGAGFDGSVDLSAFAFSFEGQSFTLTSADRAPSALFADGSFIGIDYVDFNASPTAQFMAGFFDISEAFFTYGSTSMTGEGGLGSVFFSVVGASVPEPSGIALAVTGLAMLGAVRRRRSH